MSLWTFSDVFEEGGVVQTPFYGGFGLIAAGNIPKAAFNAMCMLRGLGDRRLPVASNNVLATKDADGSISVAAWNYFAPEEKGTTKTLQMQFKGIHQANAAHCANIGCPSRIGPQRVGSDGQAGIPHIRAETRFASRRGTATHSYDATYGSQPDPTTAGTLPGASALPRHPLAPVAAYIRNQERRGH